MPTEFEWKTFPGITSLDLLEKIQSLMRDLQCEPEHFKDRIIFVSMYNDIEWKAKGNKERCEYNSQKVANFDRKFPRGHWSFLAPDKTDGSWNQSSENTTANFSGSGHPVFCASSAVERGELKSKGHGKKSFHFNGSHENIELLLTRVISANQFSIYQT